MQLQLLVLATLQGLAAAQNTVFSEVLCVTASGRVSRNPVPRSTITETTRLTFRTTVCSLRTATRTVTPAARTVTGTTSVTVFRTRTATTVGSTITAFATGDPVTVTNVVTEPSTSTSVSTSTVTENTTPTQTQQPPPGFTALSEEPDFVPKKKKRSLAGRIPLLAKRSACKRKPAGPTGLPARATARQYPQSVRCVKIIKTASVVTVTSRPCATTLTRTATAQRSTVTVSRTVTNFVPTTVVVSADTTVTVTQTPTVTDQSTATNVVTEPSTTTTTTTVTAPASTVYAACGTNNQVSAANGNHPYAAININTPTSNNQVSSRDANTAYDCCVACQLTENCVFSYYDNAGSCEVVIGTTCNPQDNQGTSFETAQDGALIYVLSNGPCGRIANGGDVS